MQPIASRSPASARRERVTKLSIVVTGDDPPTEFCIFTAGVVESTKGSVTFDAAAAKSVMAEYAEHGIDLMIDYDHASLAFVSIDPAQAGKLPGGSTSRSATANCGRSTSAGRRLQPKRCAAKSGAS